MDDLKQLALECRATSEAIFEFLRRPEQPIPVFRPPADATDDARKALWDAHSQEVSSVVTAFQSEYSELFGGRIQDIRRRLVEAGISEQRLGALDYSEINTLSARGAAEMLQALSIELLAGRPGG